jgi:hypothetical protein
MKTRSQTVGRNPPSQTELRLKALLEEYSSLRKESVSAIGYRIQIVTFTFAALAVIVAGLLTRNVPDLLAGIISLFVVPQIAKASLLMWLGEYHRSIRAGRYLREIEAKVNSLTEPATLAWESELALKKRHMSYPYVATAFVILGTGHLASALGIYLLSSLNQGVVNLKLTVGLVIYVALLEATFFGYFCHVWYRIRKP